MMNNSVGSIDQILLRYYQIPDTAYRLASLIYYTVFEITANIFSKPR